MKKTFTLLFLILSSLPLFGQDLVVPFLIVSDWIRCDSLYTRAAKISSTLELSGTVGFGKLVVSDSMRNEGTSRLKGTVTIGATATPVTISTTGKVTATDTVVSLMGVRSEGEIRTKAKMIAEDSVRIGEETAVDDKYGQLKIKGDLKSGTGITSDEFVVYPVQGSSPSFNAYWYLNTPNGRLRLPNYISNSVAPSNSYNFTTGSIGASSLTATQFISTSGSNATNTTPLTVISVTGRTVTAVKIDANKSSGNILEWSNDDTYSATGDSGGYIDPNGDLFVRELNIATGEALKVGSVQWDVTATDSINGASIGARTVPNLALQATLAPATGIVLSTSNATTTKIDTMKTAGGVVRWLKITTGGHVFWCPADTSIVK